MNNHDDDFLKNLSQQWQQTDHEKPDLSILKKRLLKNRVTMIGLTLIDLLITTAVLLLFYKGYKEGYSTMMMIWIGFGLIFGLVTTIICTNQRLRAWQIKDMDTKSWLTYEYQRSKGQLAYSKLIKYGVFVFGLFFHIWLFIGFFFDESFLLISNFKISLIYLLSMGWFCLFWWAANKIKSKALIALDYLDREKQGFNDF